MPIVKPIIAKNVVKENVPPLLDLRYLYPNLRDIRDTKLFH